MTTVVQRILMSTPIDTWKVRQVIAFDWHDGPQEGICAFDYPACELYFVTLAQQWLGGRFGDRLYKLSQLSGGALTRTLAAFGVPVPPHVPTWAPHGDYETEEIRARVEAELDGILDEAIPTSLIVRSPDMMVFSEIWISPLAETERVR